ncbi:hypothetical protein ES703_94070 [subsurface metagenome]
MNEYTKGEWKVKGGPHQYMIVGKDDGDLIADCYNNLEEAQLIASAPDLYEALRTIIEALHSNEVARAYRVAESNGIQALAKAEGNNV